jgi:hypothetical protein
MKNNRQSRIGEQIKRQLLIGAHGICAMCGSRSQFLEICHKVPLSSGGTNDPDNLLVLCPDCHRLFDSGPTELHFVQFISDLIRRNPDYSDVNLEAAIGRTQRYRADIVAHRRNGQGKETVIVECKSFSVLAEAQLQAVIGRLEEYSNSVDDAHLVLAFPGRASDSARHKLTNSNIELWDIDRIADLFSEQIISSEDAYYRSVFLRAKPRTSLDERYIREIKSCPAGHENWMEYQKLIGRVLEYLFCPPLTSALEQHSDASRTNRRDFIFPNYASDGFWLYIRSRYGADYIVVDAKNGKGKTKKSHILQIANYLKPHGVGLFGMILCRNGTDAGARTTLREQWLFHNKLIIVINDSDLEAMLLAKTAGGDPTSVLGDRIQQFRLSV